MNKVKFYIDEELLKRIPFAGPQYAYMAHIMKEMEDLKEKNHQKDMIIEIQGIAIQKLNLWHNRESKTWLTTPSGEVKTGGQFIAHDLDYRALLKEELSVLSEILEGTRR